MLIWWQCRLYDLTGGQAGMGASYYHKAETREAAILHFEKERRRAGWQRVGDVGK